MYTKVFSKILDSSIAIDWQVRHVFMDLLVLADRDGIVDMTVDAIARRTSLPLEMLRNGIAELEKPDPESTSAEHGGRRLIKLDSHRSWGWRIVNHQKYRNLRTLEDRRYADAERQRRHREKSNRNPPSHPVTDGHALSHDVRQADADADADEINSCSPQGERSSDEISLDDLPFDTLEALPSAPKWGSKEKLREFREEFWPAWPRKVARAAAERAWLKHASTPEIASSIVKAVNDQTAMLTVDGLTFCPHAVTWLNDKRFLDDPNEATLTPAVPLKPEHREWRPAWEGDRG